MAHSERIFLVAHHHSDLLWRRTREDYARVREAQILQAFDYLEQHADFRFTFAQTEVIKTFLREHPELAGRFADYVAAGRIELTGGCVGIPDTNMPGGESLLRNLLLGRRWCRERFGVEVSVACLMDAFGMCGQLPQLLRGCGFSWLVPGRMPGKDPALGHEFRWRGLDGSEIPVADHHGQIQAATHVCNLPVAQTVSQRLRSSSAALWELPGNVLALMATEEDLFQDEIFPLLEELAAIPGAKALEWARTDDYLATCDPAAWPVHEGEFNPTFTGCYTSHIRLKQLDRAAEAAVLAAEAAGAAAELVRHDRGRDPAALDALWEELAVCQFHDCICGCHTDAVYDQLQDIYAQVLRTAERLQGQALGGGSDRGVFNPLPTPRHECLRLAGHWQGADGVRTQADGDHTWVGVDLPALGVAPLPVRPGAPSAPAVVTRPGDGAWQTQHYDLAWRDGRFAVQPRFLAANPLAAPFGEVFFREDAGDMWRESYLGPRWGQETGCEQLERVEEGPLFTRLHFLGRVAPQTREGTGHGVIWRGFEALWWEKRWTFFADRPVFELELAVNFRGCNTQVHIDFPLTLDPNAAAARYGVPFGSILRAPYYEVRQEYRDRCRGLTPGELATAHGAWPALDWVDYADLDGGLTVASRGTPAHRLQNGAVSVTLLRSVTGKASQFEPGPSALENGRRVYRFAFLPHAQLAGDDSLEMATAFAHPPVLLAATDADGADRLELSGEGIVASACKVAEDGRGVVLRAYEAFGQASTASLRLPGPPPRVHAADFAEQRGEALDPAAIPFAPHQIRTIVIER